MKTLVLMNGRPTVWNPSNSSLLEITLPPNNIQNATAVATEFPTLADAIQAVDFTKRRLTHLNYFTYVGLVDPMGK
jgi:hypothetical protein